MRVVKDLEQPHIFNRWKTPLANYACATRPVAAIMLIRIEDFGALADQDQTVALSILEKTYKLQEYYARQNGFTRMVKLGDTVLLVFDTVEQAVHSALKIARSVKRMFSHQLSFGIHLGEVRYVDGDVFGGPVNIAYDVQKVAKPGEILLSEAAARSLGGGKFRIEPYGTSGPMSLAIFRLNATSETGVQLWNHQPESQTSAVAV